MDTQKEIIIVSFKHNGKVHRSWHQTTLIEENEDCFVVASMHSLVVESDGRRWLANEPAVSIFFKKEWFNVVAMLRDDGIYYYVNIASPSVMDDGMIKYIDYDLDYKVSPDYYVRTLDEFEYKRHRKILNYSIELDEVIKKVSKKVKKMIINHDFPFIHENIEQYYDIYLQNKDVRR